MADTISVRVEGFREAEQAMMELPGITAKAAARRVLKKAGQPIAEAGRSLAPRLTGNLQESYTVSTRLTKRQRRLNRRESEVEMYVGPNDPAAIQTEFGNEHQAAEPHLRPAWEENKREALKIIERELAAEIERTVSRFRKRMAKRAR